MKVPFRFMRGELLSGVYLKNFLLCKNSAVQYLLDELVYQAMKQWKLESEVTSGEVAVSEDDIVALAKFAGIFKPIQYRQNNLGSIRFTESNVVGGAERSERGLFNMSKERFEFVRTEQDDYPTDISTEASSAKRETLVPTGAVPAGYVPLGVDIYDETGAVIWANILSSPPTDGTPYTTYYGENYLAFEETFNGYSEMSSDMFFNYFNSLQRIKRNGASISELLYLTDLIGGGCITELEIVQVDYRYVIYYTLDTDVAVDNRSGRISTWNYIIESRYKDFTVSERT